MTLAESLFSEFSFDSGAASNIATILWTIWLLGTGVCFSLFYYMFLFLVTCARL